MTNKTSEQFDCEAGYPPHRYYHDAHGAASDAHLTWIHESRAKRVKFSVKRDLLFTAFMAMLNEIEEEANDNQ